MTDRVLYSSFNPMSLERMHQLNPDIPTAFLYDGVKPVIEYFARNMFWVAVHPEYIDMFRDHAVEHMQAMGFRVNVWTVNGAEDTRKLIDLGVDGIITNRPDMVRRVLEEK